jgi:hypothetical protein
MSPKLSMSPTIPIAIFNYLKQYVMPARSFFLRMAIWLGGVERWYLVLGGVAVGHKFEPQSDLELFFAEIL